MKPDKIKKATIQPELLPEILPATQVIFEYREPEYQMASGGSTQVLGDFLEFTDYLIPTNRIIQMFKSSRQSVYDDLYSTLPNL